MRIDLNLLIHDKSVGGDPEPISRTKEDTKVDEDAVDDEVTLAATVWSITWASDDSWRSSNLVAGTIYTFMFVVKYGADLSKHILSVRQKSRHATVDLIWFGSNLNILSGRANDANAIVWKVAEVWKARFEMDVKRPSNALQWVASTRFLLTDLSKATHGLEWSQIPLVSQFHMLYSVLIRTPPTEIPCFCIHRILRDAEAVRKNIHSNPTLQNLCGALEPLIACVKQVCDARSPVFTDSYEQQEWHKRVGLSEWFTDDGIINPDYEIYHQILSENGIDPDSSEFIPYRQSMAMAACTSEAIRRLKPIKGEQDNTWRLKSVRDCVNGGGDINLNLSFQLED